MKVKPTKIIKCCNNCINNVEDYPPHTYDECDALNTPDYYMWECRRPLIKSSQLPLFDDYGNFNFSSEELINIICEHENSIIKKYQLLGYCPKVID